MEAPEDQVVVCVVPCIPDRYIPEQTTVSAQYVVGLGAHLPAAPVHVPYAAVLKPRRVSWKEVAAHVLQYLLPHVL